MLDEFQVHIAVLESVLVYHTKSQNEINRNKWDIILTKIDKKDIIFLSQIWTEKEDEIK